MLARGNYFVLPLLGLLVGLVWHIHIALAPTIVLVPVALFLAKKMPSVKQTLMSFIVFLVPSIPLIAFEVRHGFSQTISLVNNIAINQGGGTGFEKLQILLIKGTDNIMRLFFYPHDFSIINKYLLVLIILASAVLLVKKNIISKKELFIFYAWILVNILFYSISSVVFSEYYFANIEIIFIFLVSSCLYLLYKSSKLGKLITLSLLLCILISSAVNIKHLYIFRKGYVERKAAAMFITQNSREKGFPCVSISYITSPGENVGFRYFFWLNNLNVTKVQKDSVTYSIVNPPEFAQGKQEKYFGQIKIIIPEEIPTKEQIQRSCIGGNINLTGDMFGFTK